LYPPRQSPLYLFFQNRFLIPASGKGLAKGYWNQIEGYIQTHSDAQFSHGICPECSDELYGKEDWYIEMKNEESQEE